MALPPISELPIERLAFFSSPIVEPRVRDAAFSLLLSHIEGGGSEGRFNCCRALRQFGVDHRCDLFPDQGIILDFVMWFIQVARNPGIVVAIDSTILIRHLEIANDVRVAAIGCTNTRPSVDKTFCLIEVDGIANVRRNYRIVVAWFMDAVHLDRQQDWNALLP